MTKKWYARCLRCQSTNIRSGDLEDMKYCKLDHYICNDCNFRWFTWNNHLWIMEC